VLVIFIATVIGGVFWWKKNPSEITNLQPAPVAPPVEKVSGAVETQTEAAPTLQTEAAPLVPPASDPKEKLREIEPWTEPVKPLTQNQRTDVTDLQDASWVPFRDPYFKDQDIFIFRPELKMIRCIEDTLIRALMVRAKELGRAGEWSYSSYSQLTERLNKIRSLAGNARFTLTMSGCHALYALRSLPVQFQEIRKLFQEMRLGVVTILGTPKHYQGLKNAIEFGVPTEESEKVDKYVLIRFAPGAHHHTCSGLAKRLDKDSFKMLWSRDEMADFCEGYAKTCDSEYAQYPNIIKGSLQWIRDGYRSKLAYRYA